MKKNSIVTFCLLINSLPCLGDTFTLKDGSSFEAKIISEVGDTYVLDVQVTKSIKDERKVLKSDVTKIQSVKHDLVAFERIQKFTPTPDLLSADEYSLKISAVEKFLNLYGQSSKVKDATAILETLKSEAAQISGGAIKFNGNMISAADYKLNAYELDAQVQDAKIRRFLKAGQTVQALRAFTKFDVDYSATNVRRALLPLIKKAMQDQAAEATQLLNTLEARTKERETGLQRMSVESRRITVAAMAEEDAAFKAQYDAELQATVGWPTLSPFIQESLDETLSFSESEMARIQEPLSYTGDSGKAYRDAWASIHHGENPEAISTAMSVVTEALIPERYTAKLEAAAAAATPAEEN